MTLEDTLSCVYNMVRTVDMAFSSVTGLTLKSQFFQTSNLSCRHLPAAITDTRTRDRGSSYSPERGCFVYSKVKYKLLCGHMIAL